MAPREELQKLLDTLATQRDELVVRAHLARLEEEEGVGRARGQA